MIDWEVHERFFFFAGLDVRTNRRCVALYWGWRPDADEGEECWRHVWYIQAPSWPIITYRDEQGRAWPAGVMMFGRCWMWRRR